MQKKEFQKGGCEYVTTAISEAVNNLTRTAVISGYWEIDREIRLPSDFTLILRDCHLRMADGTFDNMFRNEGCGDVLARQAGSEDRNIRILGVGEAILDGGEYNGLSERNAGRDGRPPMYVNNLLLFVNVEGFDFTARVEPTSTAHPGDEGVEICLENTKIHLFDKETERTICN